MDKCILYIASLFISLLDKRISKLSHKKELKELMEVKRTELFNNISKIKELIHEETQHDS